MYAADVKGQRLNFTVSGMLWEQSLVMRDEETESLWGHLLGRAMQGPLAGTVLEPLPSVITDWTSWKTRHPNTTVLQLEPTVTGYDLGMYRNLAGFVVGMADSQGARAWPLHELKEDPVRNDEFHSQPILLVFDEATVTTHGYRRDLDGQTLTFAMQGESLVDTRTASVWDAATGECTEGTYKGRRLEPVVTILSFKTPWRTFHPPESR